MKRTVAEVQADNCLGLAAQLAYYFFLALFPALLFMVALASFFPVANLMDQITAALDSSWLQVHRRWAGEVSAADAQQGRKFYSYANRRMDVLVDAQGRVISLGLY